MSRCAVPAILILLLLVSCEAGASCGFAEPSSSPVIVYGKEDATRSILNLGLAGDHPFIVYSHLQDKGALEKLLSGSRGRVVLTDGRDVPGRDGKGRQSVHLFYGEERVERTFSIEAGEYLIRAAAEPEGGTRNLRLDGRVFHIKNGCLEKRVALSGGRHTLVMEGGGWSEAAIIEADGEGKGPLPQVRYIKINPTRYVADVSGATGPFTLVLGVSYNRNWKAFIRDTPNPEEPFSALLSRLTEKRTEPDAHLMVNGYANGWVIEPGAADFQMVIEYEPQQYVEAGLAVSGATFAISGIVLFLRRNIRG